MQPQPPGGPPSRIRLLRAAKRLFAARGYEQTATSAIAREANTSESQLMRYFGGKVGLLHALFDAAWADLDRHVERAAAGGPTPATLVHMLAAVTDALVRDPDLAALFLFESRRLRGGRPRIFVASGSLAFADRIRATVRQAQAAGEIDPALEPGAVASALMGAAEAMFRDRILARSGTGRSVSARDFRQTLEAMLAGFAPATPRRARRSPGRPVRRKAKAAR